MARRLLEARAVPSFAHEAPLSVLRQDPALVATLLRDVLGVAVPEFGAAEVTDADFTQPRPAEYRADLVIALRGGAPAFEVVMGIVVEVQRARDDRKRRTWPLYLAALHARLACPTCLVVIATDEAVASWAAAPITSFQPGAVFAPIVLGPAQVPRVDLAVARGRPWLAVLSALAHGNGPGGQAITHAAIAALAGLHDERATIGYDLIYTSLTEEARRTLEDEMQPGKYEYQSDFARRYFGEGREAGREEGREAGREEGRLLAVRTLLRELATRRLGALAAADQARIDACADAERLERLLLDVFAASDAAAIERLLATL